MFSSTITQPISFKFFASFTNIFCVGFLVQNIRDHHRVISPGQVYQRFPEPSASTRDDNEFCKDREW